MRSLLAKQKQKRGKEPHYASTSTSISISISILLLAFALRLYQLEGQSMWSDEGLSLYRLRQPVSLILQNSIIVDGINGRDTNPPLYFLLLHGWRALTGESLFALRYGGVLLALLAVPLFYRVGRLFMPRRAALLATFLLAISPFHIWQSQELRNYGLLITLNLLATYALFRFAQGHAWRWLLLWVTAVLLGSYTHYFGFFIAAYGAAALLFLALCQWRASLLQLARQQWRWLLAAGAGALLLLPALLVALERFRAGQQVDFAYIPAATVAHHALSAFAVGISPILSHPWHLIGAALLLALLGVVLLARRHWPTAVLLLSYQLIPLALLQLLSLFNPLYNGTRHLLIGLPPFLLLLAAGAALPMPALRQTFSFSQEVERLIRLLRAGVLITAVAIQLNALHNQFHAPQFVRDDVRGAALYLTQHARANDLIVLHDTLIGFTFDYYYQGAAPWRAIPLYGQMDVAAAQAELAQAGAQIGQQGGRLWLLAEPLPRTGFPRRTLLEWARQQWPLLWARQFPHMWLSVRLEAYAPQPVLAQLPPQATPLDVAFANGLALRGLEQKETWQAGEDVWLRLFWSRQAEVEANLLMLSWRLTGPDGAVWAQLDQPLWPDYPPHRWPSGALVMRDLPLALPVGLPPGAYDLTLRLTTLEGETIGLADGRIEASSGTVQMTAGAANPPARQLPPMTRQTADLGPLRLLGYRLPALELRPGHVLPLDLFWQAQRAPREAYHLRLRLTDGAGAVLQEAIMPLTRADYPTALWQAGEVVQGRGELLVPGTAVADDSLLRLALITPQGRVVGREITLNQRPTIVPWPLQTELPPIPQPLDAQFGAAQVRLHGYALEPPTPTPGNWQALTLIWQAQQNISENWLVFVHLSNAQEQVVAQTDGIPVQGTRLTVSWRAAEVLLDERALFVPADLPPGAYTLWVGLYDPETGARLPVSGADADVANGRVRLATFRWGEP